MAAFRPPPDFTEEDLYQALALVTDEARARDLARSMSQGADDGIGRVYSVELLALLSLASPETRRKADAWADAMPDPTSVRALLDEAVERMRVRLRDKGPPPGGG